MPDMTLADWIRGSGRTVAAVAVDLGVSRVQVHRIASGSDMPRPATVRRIEALTGGRVTAADIFAAYRGDAA